MPFGRHDSWALFALLCFISYTGAELHGLIMALETAVEVIEYLQGIPRTRVYINMDSMYVKSKGVLGVSTSRMCISSNG